MVDSENVKTAYSLRLMT